MRKDGLVVTLEMTGCWVCNKSWDDDSHPGWLESRIPCSTCNGTRRGPRGGRNGCKKCYDGKMYSGVYDRPCTTCNGTGRGLECRTDNMPDEWWFDMPFVVYRDGKRAQTFAEAYLGVGFFSCTDYGRAYGSSDESVIEDVRDHKHHQLCKAIKETRKTENNQYTLCNHVGIVVHRNGYSVVPMFMDGTTYEDAISNDVAQKVYGEFAV